MSSQSLPSESLPTDSGLHPASTRRVSDRLMLWIMAGLLFVVGAVSLARWNEQVSRHPVPDVRPVAERQLLFLDGVNGDVRVVDAASGASVGHFARGEGSFVRGVIRSLTRARSQQVVLPEQPFTLQQYPGGRLILSDPRTGERIELNAFGTTNAGVFVSFFGSIATPAGH